MKDYRTPEIIIVPQAELDIITTSLSLPIMPLGNNVSSISTEQNNTDKGIDDIAKN